MKRLNKLLLLLWAVFLIALLGLAPANAQSSSRSLRWERYDVDISNIQTSVNKFDVVESYELYVEYGSFGGGDVTIPTDRLTGLTNIKITDGGQELKQRSTSSPIAGTFYFTQSGGNLNLTYDFFQRANTGETRYIKLYYTVTGALRSYPDGDQLYWVAIPADKPISVMASKVTVKLPDGLNPDVYTTYPDTWPGSVEGSTLTWSSPSSIAADESLEVRVQYKHDPAMTAPPWQGSFDLQRNYEEKIQPLVNLGLAALGVLIAIGGTILVYIEYGKRKDPEVGPVPEYLSEPPSNEPPAVVHALLTEKVEVRDIIATLVDLARRGFVVFEQNRTEGLMSMFGGTEFTFHRTGNDETALTSFEKMIMQAFFRAGATETSLSQLRNKFYQYIPNLQRAIYAALVTEGFYTQSPEATRGQWMLGGIALMALGGVGGFLALSTEALVAISPMLCLPLFGVAFVGLVTLIGASAMPRRTEKGAIERAKWLAFRKYLSNIKQYTDVSQATEQFEKYIGYAVAFGIDRQWTREFSNVLTSYPTWYYPTYLGGRWGRGYRRGGYGYGTPDFGQPDFGSGMGNIGGLNEMSHGLTEGLNSLSDGLTKMLNDASSAMTSRPSSSSSGGRGFSGGGSHGGGGSGGGSRGFH